MFESHLADLARTIQLAVAPVFLLSGIGTMLAVLSTRLGRIVDRARVLSTRLAHGGHEEAAIREELGCLAHRRRIINLAIVAAVMAALSVCLVIAAAFVGFLLNANVAYAISALFIAAMIAFISALILFLREVLIAVSSTRINALPNP